MSSRWDSYDFIFIIFLATDISSLRDYSHHYGNVVKDYGMMGTSAAADPAIAKTSASEATEHGESKLRHSLPF